MTTQKLISCCADDNTLFSQHHFRHAQTLETPLLSADLREEPHSEHRNIHAKPRRLYDSKRQRLSLDASHSFECETQSIHLGNTAGQHVNSSLDRSETPSEPWRKIDLNPCHICRRKPTVKSELDSYADCEGCGKRTCYICIRECLGSMVGSTALRTDRYDIEGDYDVLALSFEGVENMYTRTRNSSLRVSGSGYEGGSEDLEAIIGEKGHMTKHRRMVCSKCCVERGMDGEVWCLGCLSSGEEDNDHN